MDTNQPGLAEVLFGRTRLRVLAWLYGHPDETYYLSELKRHAKVAQGALQRELLTLTEAGLIERSTRGRHVFFQARRNNPVYEELRSILAKTVGVADVLRHALAPLADKIRVAFVYGSVAAGTEAASSDIDLAVIGEAGFARIVGALAEAHSNLGREINPTVFPSAEFRSKLGAGHHFLNAVLEGPKIFIVGDEHELARLAETRLGKAAPLKRKRGAGATRRARSRAERQRGD